MNQYSGVLQINLSAIRSNWQLMRENFQGKTCGAVIKSNAYGLGVAPVAQALYSEGCNQFFVSTVGEGIEVKRLLPSDIRVYVLQGCRPGSEHQFIESGLSPVLCSMPMVMRWLSVGGSQSRQCAIKVNSGMNRLGLAEDEFYQVLHDIRLSNSGVQLLISHLACADEPGHPLNDEQLLRFNRMVSACRNVLPNIQYSLANSAGVALPKAFHFDVGRPGIALYGSGQPMLTPVVSLYLPVIQIRSLSVGESVGYGATFIAPRDMRIAIVGGGYADGILRSLSNLAQGWYNGLLPVLGRVSMDSTIFDVSHLRPTHLPKEGDLIELLGEHIKLDQLAASAGTISYELLTRLGQRLERRYLE